MTEPTTPTGGLAHDGSWGPDYPDHEPTHSSDPDDCPACRFIARIEAEAAAAEREKHFAPHPGDEHVFYTSCLLCGLFGRINLTITGPDERVTIEALPDD